MSLYIHQLKKWPQFSWNKEHIAGQLNALHLRQGIIIGQMQAIGFELSDEVFLQTVTSDILKSSEIEGELLNQMQVRSSVARKLGLDLAGLVASDRNIDGVVEMMLDATQLFMEPLTKKRLFSWHTLLFPNGHSGLNKIKVAKWRDDLKGPMQVVSGGYGREKIHFVAPEAKKINSEMNLFLKWFNAENKLDTILKAAIAHLWFVTIHPFEDGNGRIARALTDLLLARADGSQRRFYSMSTQIQIDVKKYYICLEQAQKGTLEITDWLSWFVECLDRSLAATEKNMSMILKKSQFWSLIEKTDINSRQRQVINKLLGPFTGKLTSSKWAKLTKCSQDTALRDISDLLERGILVKESSGGRSTSYRLK